MTSFFFKTTNCTTHKYSCGFIIKDLIHTLNNGSTRGCKADRYVWYCYHSTLSIYNQQQSGVVYSQTLLHLCAITFAETGPVALRFMLHLIFCNSNNVPISTVGYMY